MKTLKSYIPEAVTAGISLLIVGTLMFVTSQIGSGDANDLANTASFLGGLSNIIVALSIALIAASVVFCARQAYQTYKDWAYDGDHFEFTVWLNFIKDLMVGGAVIITIVTLIDGPHNGIGITAIVLSWIIASITAISMHVLSDTLDKKLREESRQNSEKITAKREHRKHLNRHRPQTIMDQLLPGCLSGAWITDFYCLLAMICECIDAMDDGKTHTPDELLQHVKPHLWGSYINIDETNLKALLAVCLDYCASHDDIIRYGKDKTTFVITIPTQHAPERYWTTGDSDRYSSKMGKDLASRQAEWHIDENLDHQNFYECWFGDLSDEFDVAMQEEMAKAGQSSANTIKQADKPATAGVETKIAFTSETLLNAADGIADTDVQDSVKTVADELDAYNALNSTVQTSASRALFAKYLPLYSKAIQSYIQLETTTVDKTMLSDVKARLISNGDLLVKVIQGLIASANANDEMVLSADLSVLESLLKPETSTLTAMGADTAPEVMMQK